MNVIELLLLLLKQPYAKIGMTTVEF